MRAISSFRREGGIDVESCIALLALRMRVSMSAIGSVCMALPARFGHAGDLALVRELAQADPAEAELLEDRARPAAAVAARVLAHLVARLALGLRGQGLLSHSVPLSPRTGTCHPSCPSLSGNGRPSPRRSA